MATKKKRQGSPPVADSVLAKVRSMQRAPVMDRPREGLAVNDAGGGAIELLIYDDIGPSWAGMIDAKSVADQLAGYEGVSQIDVRINSIGGDVFEGIAIHNILARHQATVIVTIDGAALSAASIIAMAGDRILMPENSLMMIHDPWSCMCGTATDFREVAEILDKHKGNIVATYATRTERDSGEIAEMMANETWMNADEAVELGFADEKIVSKTTTTNAGNAANRAASTLFKNAPSNLADVLATRPNAGVGGSSCPAAPRLARARLREMQSVGA